MVGRLQTVIETSNLSRRSHNAILRRINLRLAARHMTRNVPKHFERVKETNPASGGYRYLKRSRQHKQRKERAGVDPLRPNVLTGELRRTILSTGRIEAFPTRWNWRARGSFDMPVDRVRELEAVSAEEIRQNRDITEREYAKLARRPEFRRKRKRKVG